VIIILNQLSSQFITINRERKIFVSDYFLGNKKKLSLLFYFGVKLIVFKVI
jgi:hypothetical protein